MSDEESRSARKRMWKITSGVFIVLINNLLTSSVGHYREISDLGQYIKALVWDFPAMTSLSVNNYK